MHLSFSRTLLASRVIYPFSLQVLMELLILFRRWFLFGLSTSWAAESSCFLLLLASVPAWLSWPVQYQMGANQLVLLLLSCYLLSTSSLLLAFWPFHGSVSLLKTNLLSVTSNGNAVPAEYAPLAIRTRAAALATASNWIFTFLVVEITPVSIHNIGWRTYVYFAVFNFCFLPLIYFFYPETRNLSLEDIDKLFTGDKILLHWKPSMDESEGTGPLPAVEKKQHGESQQVEYVKHDSYMIR